MPSEFASRSHPACPPGGPVVETTLESQADGRTRTADPFITRVVHGVHETTETRTTPPNQAPGRRASRVAVGLAGYAPSSHEPTGGEWSHGCLECHLGWVKIGVLADLVCPYCGGTDIVSQERPA